MSKSSPWFILMMIMLVLTSVAEGGQLGPTDLGVITKSIQGISLARFYQAIESKEFEMPSVHSPWSVANTIRDYSLRNKAVAAREFAGALFMRIESWAEETKAAKPAVEPIRQFLGLADWLMKSPGYGNFFLAKRCHEIAMFAIARALVETSLPIEGVTDQFPRFETSWKTPAGRAQILNDDVGARLFEIPSGDEKAQQQYLERLWALGNMMALKYSSSEMQAAFEGHPPPGLENVSETVRRWYLGAYETPFMREHVSFFKDDGKVSATTWNVNNHEALIVPYQQRHIAVLKALAEFRSAIGLFPGEYVPNESASTSKQKAAFVQAWQDYRTKKGLGADPNVAVSAWEGYREIMSGAFRDEGAAR